MKSLMSTFNTVQSTKILLNVEVKMLPNEISVLVSIEWTRKREKINIRKWPMAKKQTRTGQIQNSFESMNFV